MGAPASNVDIANLALDYVSQPPISNIDNPQTDTELLVARHYDHVRQNVWRKYIFNFNRTVIALNLLQTPPPSQFTDAYQLPDDFIRLLHLGDQSSATATGGIPVQAYPGRCEFMISGDQLWINNGGNSTLNVFYIYDEKDVNKWDSLATKVVALTLALEIAPMINKDKELVKQLDALLRAEIPDAASVAGQEVKPVFIQRSRIVAARERLSSNSGNVAPPWTYIP